MLQYSLNTKSVYIKFIKEINSCILVFKKQIQITNYIIFCVLFHLSSGHGDIYKKVQFIKILS